MKNRCDFGISFNENETMEFGKELAKQVEPGDVFRIQGNLGVGKTTFIKGVLGALGYDGIVTSPTYTLINEYNIEPKVIHIDCYRESNLDRWYMLGINEYFENNYIVFIEWSDIIESFIPKRNSYNIKIKSISSFKREIKLIS